MENTNILENLDETNNGLITKEDAINARKQAEIKYFGEFANTERS